MTEINFYVSKEEGLEHRLAIVHRLVILALKRKMKIHIHTDSEATNAAIDDYLWTKDYTSFIPHEIITVTETQVENIIETHSEASNKNNDEIGFQQINISHEVELDNNEEIITAGRKRYSFYRDRGYTLRYHQL